MTTPLTKDNPARELRDVTIANQRLQGATYLELAQEHNLSKMTISRILTDPEIKDVLNTGTQEIVKLIPKAVDNYDKLLASNDEKIVHKASQDMLKTVGIMPTHTVNQFFTSIINADNINIGDDVLSIVGKHIDQEILEGVVVEDDNDSTK